MVTANYSVEYSKLEGGHGRSARLLDKMPVPAWTSFCPGSRLRQNSQCLFALWIFLSSLLFAELSSLVQADIVIPRDTFGQADGNAGGVISGFPIGQAAYSALGYQPAMQNDWTVNTLQSAGVLSSNGTPNIGNMLNQDFLIADVKNALLFNVTDARIAFQQNLQYQHADFYFRAAPDNPNYHIPYNTNGTAHLFNLTFNGFSIDRAAGQDGYLSLIGLSAGGISGDLGIGLTPNNLHPDRFAADNFFGGFSRPNQDFGFSNSYAMTISGVTAVPEPTSLVLIAALGGLLLSGRRRR